MYSLSSKKEFVNPYRHGVSIGNYVEDLIAKDRVKDHKKENPDLNNYLSEMRDKYCGPKSTYNKNIKEETNRKPKFDLNIDFSKNSMKDIDDQIGQNIVSNNNRLAYLAKTIISTEGGQNNDKKDQANKSNSSISELSKILNDQNHKDNKTEDFLMNTQRNNILSKYSDYSIDVQNQIGKQTDGFIKKDLVGLYFTTRSGLSNHLLRGHGPDQNKFVVTENISIKE